MVKVYIDTPTGVNSLIPLLYPQLGFQSNLKAPFMDAALKRLTDHFVEIVNTPKKSDYLLIPHNYYHIRENLSYIRRFESLSDSTGKKIIIFAYGDRSEPISIKNSIVFRTSMYRPEKRPNEIAMPAYTEDLGEKGVELRIKKDVPSVGFCGWAEMHGVRKLKADIKMIVSRLRFVPIFKMQGFRWRRRALRILSDSKKIKTDFIIRESYSGSYSTIKMDPWQARAEYISNIRSNDYALVVKGDGNFSYRFYEALSLGRIPLFLDTQCVLPLENIIDYDSFIMRISYNDITLLADRMFEIHSQMSAEEFILKQKLARATFEKHLRIDKFFQYYFDYPDRINNIVHLQP